MTVKKHNTVKLKSGEVLYVTHIRIKDKGGMARGLYADADNPKAVYESYFDKEDVIEIVEEVGVNPHTLKNLS